MSLCFHDLIEFGDYLFKFCVVVDVHKFKFVFADFFIAVDINLSLIHIFKATEVACIMKRLLLGLLIDCWL